MSAVSRTTGVDGAVVASPGGLKGRMSFLAVSVTLLLSGCALGLEPPESLAEVSPVSTTSSSSSATTPTHTPTSQHTPAAGNSSPAGNSSVVAPLAPPANLAISGTLQKGSKGKEVLQVQKRLVSLGFWMPQPNGTFGDSTQQAVWAFQKAASLPTTGRIDQRTLATLNQGVGLPSRVGGTGVEIDLKKQLLLWVKNGKVAQIFNASTGNGEFYMFQGRRTQAITPPGAYVIGRIDRSGWQVGELGEMYKGHYFNGPIAIHGARKVPPKPSSHGCSRVAVSTQDHLIDTGIIKPGRRVNVY